MKPFLITGCGRSGTHFMAAMLSALGIPTGWELACNPFYPALRAKEFVYTLRRHRVRGDSNWLAVPYLARIPREVRVFHQTRHPLKVIRSMLALGFFSDDYFRRPWSSDPRHANLATGNLPRLPRLASSIEWCMNYWWGWNELCETLAKSREFVYSRHAFEDVLKLETGVLGGLCRELGIENLPEPLPTPHNAHQIFAHGEGREFRWGELPDGILKDNVLRMAARYGYGDSA